MHFFTTLTAIILSSILLLISHSTIADTFVLTSTDISSQKMMPKAQEFQGFGCNGGNTSPQLSWSGAPKGTQAFAITAYDPDAPTGSGWWHWQIINIPANINSMETGAGNSNQLKKPEGSQQVKNDYGIAGFGGACPPKGNGIHRYQFTVHALSKVLELPEDPSGALTGYMIKAHSLGSATLEALYRRD